MSRTRLTRTVKGTAALAVDAVEGVTGIVEGMYRNIAAKPLPWGDAPDGPARGIAGIVFSSINEVTQALRSGVDLIGTPLARAIDGLVAETEPESDSRAALLAALNGVVGDHLESSGNPLAIPMSFRVDPGVTAEPSGKLLILVHGLCMNDRQWTHNGHNHGDSLSADFGFSPVYCLYNSGRHISTNGREFADKLGQLIADWPVAVESVTLLGHSMGGLVIRSALATKPDWMDRIDRAIYLGSPHHGAILERRGNILQKRVEWSPYTAPLGALGMIRSAGITDLRHGSVVDEDWKHAPSLLDRFASHEDTRVSTPLPPGIRHYALAATVSEESGQLKGKILGDGLVHPSSATGRHTKPDMQLQFDAQRVVLIRSLNHWGLLDDPRVLDQLRNWLND